MADDFYISNGLNGREMAILAERYRTEFDIAQSDKVDIIHVLEFKIPKAFPDFHLVIVQDEDLDDYANTVFEPLCIVVRQSIYDSANRGSVFARMILAHELGHLLLHKEHSNRRPAAAKRRDAYTENIRDLNGLESAEAQAILFARSFLIPFRTAFEYRKKVNQLATLAGVSLYDAEFAVKLSKRQEMYSLVFQSSKMDGARPLARTYNTTDSSRPSGSTLSAKRGEGRNIASSSLPIDNV